MHEGDHHILDDEHEQAHHDHKHPHEHDHTHPHHDAQRPNPSRMLAGIIVAAAVVAFLLWRFL
jgi:hypothetical protein